jgi:hypothetical protein
METVNEIAETFINGNRSDACEAIENAPTKLAAAVMACAVFERLRGLKVGGIHDANSFRSAMEARL